MKKKVKCEDCKDCEYNPNDSDQRKHCCGKERCKKCLVKHFESDHKGVK